MVCNSEIDEVLIKEYSAITPEWIVVHVSKVTDRHEFITSPNIPFQVFEGWYLVHSVSPVYYFKLYKNWDWRTKQKKFSINTGDGRISENHLNFRAQRENVMVSFSKSEVDGLIVIAKNAITEIHKVEKHITIHDKKVIKAKYTVTYDKVVKEN
jgi:hypothetical protein